MGAPTDAPWPGSWTGCRPCHTHTHTWTRACHTHPNGRGVEASVDGTSPPYLSYPPRGPRRMFLQPRTLVMRRTRLEAPRRLAAVQRGRHARHRAASPATFRTSPVVYSTHTHAPAERMCGRVCFRGRLRPTPLRYGKLGPNHWWHRSLTHHEPPWHRGPSSFTLLVHPPPLNPTQPNPTLHFATTQMWSLSFRVGMPTFWTTSVRTSAHGALHLADCE